MKDRQAGRHSDRLRGKPDMAVNTIRGKNDEVYLNTDGALCPGDLAACEQDKELGSSRSHPAFHTLRSSVVLRKPAGGSVFESAHLPSGEKLH